MAQYSSMSATPLSMEQRAIGAYIGLAVGDALGATTEFLTPREIEQNYGIHRDIIGGGWLNLKAGQVTDDTEMSLALGASLLACQSVNAESIAEAFSNWMRNKPVDIGNTVRRGIIHYRRTGNATVPENEYDAGNGACMRCLPIAQFCYHSSETERIQASRIQSHTTHNNPIADAGTEAVIEMVISGFNGGTLSQLERVAEKLVTKYPVYRFDKRRMENPSGYIVDTLQAVFQAFFSHESFEAVLVDVVNRGGDADTTGAIAGMIAGAFYGMEDIPSRWRTKIDASIIAACVTQTQDLLALSQKIYSTAE